MTTPPSPLPAATRLLWQAIRATPAFQGWLQRHRGVTPGSTLQLIATERPTAAHQGHVIVRRRDTSTSTVIATWRSVTLPDPLATRTGIGTIAQMLPRAR